MGIPRSVDIPYWRPQQVHTDRVFDLSLYFRRRMPRGLRGDFRRMDLEALAMKTKRKQRDNDRPESRGTTNSLENTEFEKFVV